MDSPIEAAVGTRELLRAGSCTTRALLRSLDLFQYVRQTWFWCWSWNFGRWNRTCWLCSSRQGGEYKDEGAEGSKHHGLARRHCGSAVQRARTTGAGLLVMSGELSAAESVNVMKETLLLYRRPQPTIRSCSVPPDPKTRGSARWALWTNGEYTWLPVSITTFAQKYRGVTHGGAHNTRKVVLRPAWAHVRNATCRRLARAIAQQL